MTRHRVNDRGEIFDRETGAILGHVGKTEGLGAAMGKWRAERGDPADPVGYRVCYGPTKRDVLQDLFAEAGHA